MPQFKTSQELTQADGVQEITTPSRHVSTCQVSIGTAASAGTLTVKAKYHVDGNFETVYEADGTTPLSLDVSDLKTFQLVDKWVYSLQFTPTGLNAPYKVCFVCGEED